MTGATASAFPIFATSASARKDQLVVSVHDVAPPTRAATEKILDELCRRHVDVTSLLVVPNYHHTGRSTDDRQFVKWLRELEGAGHEIVIHGYFHERPGKTGETLRERIVTRCYTNGEGEFFDLGYEEALRRITTARNEFEESGLKPRGFIAPAWLLGTEAEQAAADAGMEYTTRLASIVDLRRREIFHARSLVYSVRSSWRRVSSLGWNRALSHLESPNPLLRLGIHPPDLTHPNIWGQITCLVDQLTETRSCTTYRDWIADRRACRTDD